MKKYLKRKTRLSKGRNNKPKTLLTNLEILSHVLDFKIDQIESAGYNVPPFKFDP